MNKIKQSNNPNKRGILKNLKINNYEYGVTQKLLEKYKPNNSITRIDNSKRRQENERVA